MNSDPQESLRAGDVVLFQGDSITNAHRMPEEINDGYRMGAGYALMCAARIRCDRPGHGITFHNRGVSGNSTVQLLERWQADTLDVKPTVLSLLIGINDSTAFTRGSAGHYPDAYAGRLHELLDRTRSVLPDVRLILIEPFALAVGLIEPEQLPDVAERRDRVRQVAADYEATLVTPQPLFDAQVAGGGDPAYWIYDGIHPTAAGHRLLADAWLDAVGANRLL